MSRATDFRMPDRRRIYLMRHAEAAYVREDGTPAPDGRVVPLTPIGRDQAARQADALRHVHFDRAVCSGLPRTVETAGIVLAGRSAPALEVIPDLEEIQSGHAQAPAEDFAAWIAHVANPWADAAAPDARFIGGERFRDFEARVLPAFTELLADTRWRTLLLVLHGAVNRVLLNHVMNLPWQGAMSIEQDPACFNVIDVDGIPGAPGRVERFLVRAVNVTAWNLTKDGIELTDMERTAQRIAAQAVAP
jgi:probable phosphoglycerate mutase